MQKHQWLYIIKYSLDYDERYFLDLNRAIAHLLDWGFVEAPIQSPDDETRTFVRPADWVMPEAEAQILIRKLSS